MYKLRLILLCLSFSQLIFATILPENNFAIPINEKNEGLSEAQYNAVLNKVGSVYRPVLQRNGFSMTINRLWTDPRVNAGTTKKGTELIFNMYGGYARHPRVTEDGYALVMCHEIGHHLGGRPRKIFENGKEGWPSVEGQADYFATLKCLRKVFRNDDNEAELNGLAIPEVISEKCLKNFKEKWEVDICIRTSMAGLSVSAVSSDIRNTFLPTVETPDLAAVQKTYEAHPLPQCRLDTYFQGSICEVSSARPLTTQDETSGACHLSLGHVEGIRPSCWYKSSK